MRQSPPVADERYCISCREFLRAQMMREGYLERLDSEPLAAEEGLAAATMRGTRKAAGRD